MEKQISKLHTELIRIKISTMQSEIQRVVNAVAVESGIDLKNEKWNLSEDCTKFIKEE